MDADHGLPPRLIATPPREPTLSRNLLYLVRQMEDPHPTAFRDITLPDHLREEARSALGIYERFVVPAQPGLVAAWLNGVNRGLSQPLRDDALVEWLDEVGDIITGLPASVFNAATRVEAGRKFTFRPGGAEVFAFLNEYARPLGAKRSALRHLLTTRPPPPERDTLTADERAEIAADFGRRARAAIAEGNPPPPAAVAPVAEVKPGHISDRALRALYEQQAKSADPSIAGIARARLAHLGVEVAP